MFIFNSEVIETINDIIKLLEDKKLCGKINDFYYFDKSLIIEVFIYDYLENKNISIDSYLIGQKNNDLEFFESFKSFKTWIYERLSEYIRDIEDIEDIEE